MKELAEKLIKGHEKIWRNSTISTTSKIYAVFGIL